MKEMEKKKRKIKGKSGKWKEVLSKGAQLSYTGKLKQTNEVTVFPNQ